MTDNELMLALSDLLDKKLKPIEVTFNRYKNGMEQMEAMQADIDIMKKVLVEHSESFKESAETT